MIVDRWGWGKGRGIVDGMATTETAEKSPTSSASTHPPSVASSGASPEPYHRPCPYCGDWPDRHVKGYCLPCHATLIAQWRRRRKSARISRWYSEIGTADARRAAMLASAIVEELGGYDRAARQLVAWLRESVETKKAPKASMRAIQAMMDVIRLSLPADGADEAGARKKPTGRGGR